MRKIFINKQAKMWKSALTLVAFLFLCSTVVFGQGNTVTGTVTDTSGDPLIGVNVLVKGTTNGGITNIDGQYTIQSVTNSSVLVFSYIGFVPQEITLGSNRTLNVQLLEELTSLDEVVVVGYGTQTKREVTGSITTVSADELRAMPVMTLAEALMGQAAGIYISSTGAPGSPTTMRVRGVGSISGSASPLVIVDGVQNVDLNAINTNDIETFTLLKDASATAVYGARGANGVILVTTRQGSRTGRVQVSYNGYVGLSTMANNGFDVLNGWESMEFQAQAMVNYRDVKGQTPWAHAQFGTLNANDQLTMPYSAKPSGYSKDRIISEWGSVDNWVASYLPDGTNSWARSAYYQMLEDGYSEAEARKGTDWYNLIVKQGVITDHNLSIQGGNGDRGMYSVNLGVNKTEGTIIASFMDRYSLRMNSTFNPTKYLSIGANVNLTVTQSGGDRGSNSDSSPFAQSYTTQSWVPVYNVGGDFAGSQCPEGGRNSSPVFSTYSSTLNSSHNFRGQASLFAEIKPLTDLVIRTQYAPSMTGSWSTSFSPVTITFNKEGSSFNSYQNSANRNFTWQWTNTATYKKIFNVDHVTEWMLGTEAINNNVLGNSLSATRRGYEFEKDKNTWTINNGSTANLTNSGDMSDRTSFLSYFGRVKYSFKGTYSLELAFRRDASSRFSEKKRWGTFPSISGAWRVSDEAFMQSTKKYIDDLKFRAGWGRSGTAAGNAFNWAFQYGTGNSHLYAIDGTNTSAWQGYHVTNLGDVNAQWETINTITLGIDLTALKQRFTANVEWWSRKTTGMLLSADMSSQAGSATKPRINLGNMSNKGVDVQVGWRDRTKLFRYSVSANVSTYRNKVINLGSADLFNGTRLNDVNITREGMPTGQFYGYNVIGIYKSTDDVLNYRNAAGQTVVPYGATSLASITANPNSHVGRYIIEDVDGDGVITALDRKILGNPHPDFTGGLNASIQYRDFDLSTQIYFQVGNDLYKHYMFYTHYGALQSNYSKDRRDNSWHPQTNPNGKYPLWLGANMEGPEAGNVSNSMYIQDGSYMRMRNLTLGYSLPRNIIRSLGLERIRVYGQVANLFTVTKYEGLEPEIQSGSDTGGGLDYGTYGQPRQFIFGLQISFQ